MSCQYKIYVLAEFHNARTWIWMLINCCKLTNIQAHACGQGFFFSHNQFPLKGVNKMDELCPPKPNELDIATCMSKRSFLGPTSTFASWVNGDILWKSSNFFENISILDSRSIPHVCQDFPDLGLDVSIQFVLPAGKRKKPHSKNNHDMSPNLTLC